MFSIDQRVFTFHDDCCWLAAAIHMAFNNILKKVINTDDINTFILNEYGRPLGQSGSPVKAGINIMIPYIKKRNNIDATYRVVTIFGKYFNNLLYNGKLIAVPIRITELYNSNWLNGRKIEGDFSNSKVVGGHWLCIFRKNGKDYILNSGNPKYNIREIDLNTKGLFVGTKAYILY